jgi:hypothetical protein
MQHSETLQNYSAVGVRIKDGTIVIIGHVKFSLKGSKLDTGAFRFYAPQEA